MNGRAADAVPLAVRGFLLVLVACLHAAGVAAFSQLSGPQWHDEEATVLRASWIEGASPAAPLPSQPAARPIPPSPSPPQRPEQASELRARPQVPTPTQLQTVQPAPAPAAVDTALAVPGDSMPNPGADAGVSTDVAAAGGTVAGAGGGSRGRNYVAPDFNVSYFSNPKPEYPPLSRRLREQGLVKLRVHVTVEGRAGEVMLHKSSGYERLDNAALNAVKRWRFRPARQAGVPVADWAVVPMLFDLND